MITNIQKWGNSQGIRIPKNVLETAHFAENEIVELIPQNDTIIIKKTKREKRKSIEELFANYNDEYEATEIDWGKPVGREIW